MPRYLIVLSIFVWPSSICTALRFFVRRYISEAFVRLIECVPYSAGSRSIPRTQLSTNRAYCGVDIWLGDLELYGLPRLLLHHHSPPGNCRIVSDVSDSNLEQVIASELAVWASEFWSCSVLVDGFMKTGCLLLELHWADISKITMPSFVIVCPKPLCREQLGMFDAVEAG